MTPGEQDIAGPVLLAMSTPGLGDPGPVPTPASSGAARTQEEILPWSYSLSVAMLTQALGKDGGGLVSKSCPTLATPWEPPRFLYPWDFHGIPQARILAAAVAANSLQSCPTQ